MFGIRTPNKKPDDSNSHSPVKVGKTGPTQASHANVETTDDNYDPQIPLGQTEKAGPSRLNKTFTPNVRRSIDKWEASKTETKPRSPTKLKDSSPTAKSSDKIKLSQQKREKGNSYNIDDAPGTSPKTKYVDRMAEAKACLMSAKLHLGNSRNLKTDIKTGVLKAVERLYELCKEAEKANGRGSKTGKQQDKGANGGGDAGGEKEKEVVEAATPNTEPQTAMMERLIESLREHERLVTECKRHTLALTDQIKTVSPPNSTAERSLTYAQVAGKSGQSAQVHSIIVTGEGDSSGEVVDKIRAAVDAKAAGIRIDRIRKARDQKVILGCRSKDELSRIKERITGSGTNLQIVEVKNKDPLVILKNVLSYNTEEDILKALRNQNAHLFEDISLEDQRLTVKYRRRTRNPHAGHVVMQVAPKVWKRLTEAGRVHIDLQQIRVEDQSPLVQCSICLGYGHGRRFCKETVEKCSHCAGPHTSKDCELKLAGEVPTCCNCAHAKLDTADHSAFSRDCPVRRRWEALARASVAYC